MRISPDFAAGGPKHLYLEQLEDGVARSRPQTPAYPVLSAAFAGAFHDAVLQGLPVEASLDAAAGRVERAMLQHQYYPPPS